MATSVVVSLTPLSNPSCFGVLEVRHCAVGDDDLPLGSWRRVLVFFMVLFGAVLKLFCVSWQSLQMFC